MKRFLGRALPFVLTALCVPLQVHAQAYPSKSVRVVVVFPPGGSNDVTARIVFQKVSEQTGQQFVIDNRGGAAGTIGADVAVSAGRSAGAGLEKTSTTLYGSLSSIFWRLAKVARRRGWISFRKPKVWATSAEVKGLPSCHFTPCRRWNV